MEFRIAFNLIKAGGLASRKGCYLVIFLCIMVFTAGNTNAQSVPDSTFKPSGKLWGLSFGDYFYKAHGDSLNRGGSNQYTGVPKGRNEFQTRRIYLGYNYDISPKFAAELVLAAEDNFTTASGASGGDLLGNSKLSFYIKQANIRWKGIWKGTDIVLGQVSTPTFSQSSEPVWGYRAIERTIADIRRTPSFDLGLSLQGKFDPEEGNYGYNLMVGNGTSARPENDNFKWFYGDVYAKFFNKKLMVDLYADYQRQNWLPGYHHSRNMVKGFIGYTAPKITLGVEAFINHGKNDVVGTIGAVTDTLTANATGISMFVRGPISKTKLGYFARFDTFNPYGKFNDSYTSYREISTNYDPNTKERFVTAGLDYAPVKNVHLMPNIWYNQYEAQRSNLTGKAKQDYDLVYRMTFHYVFGR